MQASYTEKTERHKAYGYSYIVVRSDGKVVGSNVNRGENAVEKFLSDILQEEEKIREFGHPKADCDDGRRLGEIQKSN